MPICSCWYAKDICRKCDLIVCGAGFAKDQRKLEEIIGELAKQGVKP